MNYLEKLSLLKEKRKNVTDGIRLREDPLDVLTFLSLLRNGGSGKTSEKETEKAPYSYEEKYYGPDNIKGGVMVRDDHGAKGFMPLEDLLCEALYIAAEMGMTSEGKIHHNPYSGVLDMDYIVAKLKKDLGYDLTEENDSDEKPDPDEPAYTDKQAEPHIDIFKPIKS